MILTKKQLSKLRKETMDGLLYILYSIEDQLGYECKNVSQTIDYIQKEYFSEKINFKSRVEKAINYLKYNDYLIEEEQWLLDLLEGKHNGNTY